MKAHSSKLKGIRRSIFAFSFQLSAFSFILLVGCGTSEFPGSQTPFSGVTDVPFVTTFNFSFRTGLSDLPQTEGVLSIISAGDLLNLISAANITQTDGYGIVGGVVRDPSGSPVQGVTLILTDASGKVVGDVFYNSLGGTPDFVQASGTTENGSFTIFNVPPGEVYLKVVEGGRGNTRLISFPDAVSLTTFDIVPVVVDKRGVVVQIGETINPGTTSVPNIGVSLIGVLADADNDGVTNDKDFCPGTAPQDTVDERGCGTGQGVSDPILPGLLTVSNINGLAQFTVSSRSVFLMRLFDDRVNHLDTYVEFDSGQAQPNPQALVPQNIDITDFFNIISFEDLRALSSDAGIFQDPAKTLVAGFIRRTDGTPQRGSRVLMFTAAGTPLESLGATIVYTDALGFLNRSLTSTTTLGAYIAFNVPPGNVYLNVASEEEAGGPIARYSNADVITAFPQSAYFKSVTVYQVPDPDAADPAIRPNFTVSVGGKVVDEGGNPSPVGTQVSVLGIAENLARCPTTGIKGSCQDGTYRIEAAPNSGQTPADIPSLLASGRYLFQVTAQGHLPTYQVIITGSTTQTTERKDLSVFPLEHLEGLQHQAGVSQVDTKGMITGTLFDRDNGRPAEGASIEFRDKDLTLTGQINYFDDRTGQLDPFRTSTSRNGKYIVFNATPGLLFSSVTSPNDTGNAMVRVFAGGVVLQDIGMNNAIPPRVQVAGTAKTLNGSAVGGIKLTTLGGDVRFDSRRKLVSFDASTTENGSFEGSLMPLSSFVIKGAGTGLMDTYNFNVPTLGRSFEGMDLVTVSRQELQALSQSAGIKLDPTKGIIVGEAIASDLDVPTFIDVPGAPQAMLTAFLNLDTDLDLAVLNRDREEVAVFFGNGDGTFDLSAVYPVGNLPSSVVPADLTGDGTNDLVVANEGSNTLSIFLGNRDGFYPSVPITVPVQGNRPVDVRVGDFNGDLLADLFVLNYDSDTLSILIGDGRGNFTELVRQPPNQFPIPLHQSGVIDSCGPRSIELFTLDSDTLTDWVVTCENSNNLLFFSSQTGFTIGPLPSGYSLRGLALGNLDPDTQADIAVPMASQIPGQPGLIAVFLSSGINEQVVTGVNPSAAKLFDFNFDGQTDLLIANQGSDPAGRLENCTDGIDNDGDGFIDGRDPDCPSVWVLFGRGDGTFDSNILSVGLEPGGRGPTSVVFGDFDGNRLSDLAVSNSETHNIALIKARDLPVRDVSVEAVGINGDPVGSLFYLNPTSDAIETNRSSTITAGAQSTIRGGRFIIFNVPPGLARVRPTAGASGSHLIMVYPNAVSFIRLEVLLITVPLVRVPGVTVDSVVRPIGLVDIAFLTTSIQALSSPVGVDAAGDFVGASFGTFLEANSEFVVKLSKVGTAGGLPPVPGDDDFDSIPDNLDDCPGLFNPDQLDTDGDGIGDLCDPDPNPNPQTQ